MQVIPDVTATISDHSPQFIIYANTFPDPPSKKCNVFERDWSLFDQQNLDFSDIDWASLSNMDEKSLNFIKNNFLNAMNSLPNKHT